MTDVFDPDARYSYQGVAVVLIRPDEYWTEEWIEDGEWTDGGYYEHDVVPSETFWIVRFVGDDRPFTVDIDDLDVLGSYDSTCSCGQINCYINSQENGF